MLKESDFVISAVPLNDETKLMFNKTSFAKMKKTSVFVNIGRGGVVNHDDLVEALKNNQIFAAGLDVMTPEPLPTDHPLLQLPNVGKFHKFTVRYNRNHMRPLFSVLMPHLGSSTVKTTIAMVELAAKNILAVFDGKPLLTPI